MFQHVFLQAFVSSTKKLRSIRTSQRSSYVHKNQTLHASTSDALSSKRTAGARIDPSMVEDVVWGESFHFPMFPKKNGWVQDFYGILPIKESWIYKTFFFGVKS